MAAASTDTAGRADSTNRLLSRLLRELPEGVAAPSRWLSSQGISHQLSHKYTRSSWLVPLAHGAYARPTAPVDWRGVLLGLQRLANLPVHVGGVTALNQQGRAHYLPLGGETRLHLWLHGEQPTRLPAWAHTASEPRILLLHADRLFSEDAAAEGITGLPAGVRDWTYLVATPERALLEMTSIIRNEDDFDLADKYFESAGILRPAILTTLLTHCTSIKTKRVFLWFATRHGHPWLRQLDQENIALGIGKRSIIAGGAFDKQYQITVPRSMASGGDRFF